MCQAQGWRRRILVLVTLQLPLLLIQDVAHAADPAAPPKYVQAKAYHILPETTSEESGYFSLCEGLDGSVYIGTAKYNANAYLVEFDPRTERQRVVLDTNKVCGLTATGYAAQSKIHTRNFVGASGRVYVGSKQGYRATGDTSEYPGGYVMAYDPRTDSSQNLGMPLKGQGVIDVVADEARGLTYVVTCEEQHWMLGSTEPGGAYRELGPLLTPYATTLIDADGRASAITADFQLAQYDPAANQVTTRPIDVAGKRWTRANNSAIPTWVLTPDAKRAYLILMNDPTLLEIDLAPGGEVARATSHGKLIDGKNPDSRCAVTVAPDGRVYAVVRVDNDTGFGTGYLHHLLRFDPKSGEREDLGILAVQNPDFFKFDGPDGKQLRYGHGFHKLPDGTLTPLHAHMALVAARDGTLYVTILYPYTLLRIDAFKLPAAAAPSPAERYVNFAMAACDRAEAQAGELEKLAEIIAERHAAGGLIGFPFEAQTLALELFGRSGSMMHVGFDRPFKMDRTDAEKAKDVAIVGYDRPPGPEDAAKLKALRARGCCVIGFGPRSAAELAPVIAESDTWIDADPVAAGGAAGFGRDVCLVNVVNGWTLTAETVAALTRRGKMPPIWKSFAWDDGKAWMDGYLGKVQFHDDYKVMPVPPGDLSRRMLWQFRQSLRRLRNTEAADLARAGKLIAEEAATGRKVPTLWSGHVGYASPSVFDAPWGTVYEFVPSIDACITKHRQASREGDLILRLGYLGQDRVEAELFRSMRQRVILLTGADRDLAWRAPADVAVSIDLGYAFGDACVPVEGYPIPLFPPSGVLQLAAYGAIVAEARAAGGK
jgi:hypothetical protein